MRIFDIVYRLRRICCQSVTWLLRFGVSSAREGEPHLTTRHVTLKSNRAQEAGFACYGARKLGEFVKMSWQSGSSA
jgi:hypothetical protein